MDEQLPAWMLAQEILVKTKNELILEAIDALHREVKAKRIEINGQIIKVPERQSEIDQDVFIINNLLSQESSLRTQYEEFMRNTEGGEATDPMLLERVGELKRFLLSLTEINVTMRLSKVFNEWILDLGKTGRSDDAAAIIANSVKGNPDRMEALEFVLGDKYFEKNEVLEEAETEVLRRAFELCK